MSLVQSHAIGAQLISYRSTPIPYLSAISFVVLTDHGATCACFLARPEGDAICCALSPILLCSLRFHETTVYRSSKPTWSLRRPSLYPRISPNEWTMGQPKGRGQHAALGLLWPANVASRGSRNAMGRDLHVGIVLVSTLLADTSKLQGHFREAKMTITKLPRAESLNLKAF